MALRWIGLLAACAVIGCGNGQQVAQTDVGGGTGTGGPPDVGTGSDTGTGGADTAQPSGPKCEVLHGISCGDSVSGDNSGGKKNVSNWKCSPDVSYQGSPEATYTLTAAEKTTATITIGPLGPHDVIVSKADAKGECNPTDCVAAQSGDTGVTVQLAKGEKRFVTVERRDGGSGPFELKVECCVAACTDKKCGDDGCGGTCGQCPPGLGCTAQGQCVQQKCEPEGALLCGGKVPLSSLDSEGSTDTITSYACSTANYAGPERAWTFFAAYDETVTLKVANQNPEKKVEVLVLKNDGTDSCTPALCVHREDDQVVFEAKSGEEYFFVLDGLDGVNDLATLSVDCCQAQCSGKVCGDNGCGGVCGECGPGGECNAFGTACTYSPVGNDTCATALAIDSLPFEAKGTTAGLTDDYKLPPGCTGGGTSTDGGNDAVFAWTATKTGNVKASLSDVSQGPGEPDHPDLLFVTIGCPDQTPIPCTGVADYYDDPADSISWQAQAGTTYTIVVEGYNQNYNGTYTLNLFEP